jgi:thymidine kinase
VFDKNTDFLQTIDKKIACLLVDEAQFLSKEQVKQLHQLAQVRGVPVILRPAFGLLGEPFPGSAYLLALADDIEEIKNICTCGKKATMNIRVDENGKRIKEGAQISIGGNESYRQACGRCFYSEIH